MSEDSQSLNERDHRVIGKQMGLFCTNPLVGPGLILWMPNGGIIRSELQKFMQEQLFLHDYSPVYTPHIGSIELYKTSGHFPFYKDSQYPTLKSEDGSEEYLLKPMNCPHHAMIYAAEPRSYRDLPIRLAEFGTVYRHEQAGSLNGLTRVRGLTQDDAHLFCTPEQVGDELRGTIALVKDVFAVMGFKEFRVQISTRDASPKYIGDPAVWAYAEEVLTRSCATSNLSFEVLPGEAAFYGPKIDFMVKDCIGREWQLGTVQLDYNLPERFDLKYIGPDGLPHRPVMIHRAPFGSIERFFAILIEHFNGKFPLWLSPVHARIACISEKQQEKAQQIAKYLKSCNLRVDTDFSSDKIGAKVAAAEVAKIPYFLVVGKREAETESVSVRGRGAEQIGIMTMYEFAEMARIKISDRLDS